MLRPVSIRFAAIFATIFTVILTTILCSTATAAEKVRLALILDEPPGRAPSIESLTVSEIAGRIAEPARFYVGESGVPVDVDQKPLAGNFRSVVWFHLSTAAPDRAPFRSEAFRDALRTFLESGGGLLLTGSAATRLELLGLDSVAVKPLTFGNDRDQAGVMPTATTHPIFSELDWERGILWLSNVAYPSFSDFQAPKGALLAVNPESSNVPHLEYSLGKGKILAAPWQIGAVYDKGPEGHRKNWERFVSNMLRYLDGSLTAPAVMPSKFEAECQALAAAVDHLTTTFKERYPDGTKYRARLEELRERAKTESEVGLFAGLDALRREALLAHPRLDFDRILLVRRSEKQLGLPSNFNANSSLPKKGYDNRLVVLADWKTKPAAQTLFEPSEGRFLGDVDLHFDAGRLLMSLVDEQDRWRVFEMNLDGSNLRPLPLIPDDDVDCYDACYLPDGGVVFCSTACFAGVPCVDGTAPTCNLYRMDRSGGIRQLTYEQDQDWCPTVLNNGRLLYLRWEYTDIPHAFSRILFHANPDGTNQTEYYGSGAYWPGTMFFAKPIPDHPTKFVAVTGGHHELPRMGDLVLFDPALGRRGNAGALQRIPGRNRTVEPVMLDLPIAKNWPKFLHPAPLDEHFFLVSAKPAPEKPWGVYLVDVFDNAVLIHEEPGYAMLEPIPVQKRPKPPVVPDRIDPERSDAEIFIANIYEGQGLPGVEPGSVKKLRIFSYQFSYQNMGAEPYSIGMDGPWDARRILGTVPVYADGSAFFKIPAYTPISIQPLDEEGKAIQLMRSWITAMPGETVSCVGCHEEQNTAVMPGKVRASTSRPHEIEPWYGPTRGFSFVREVQPVLDRYCTECHFEGNETAPGIASFRDGPQKPLLENKNYINVKSRFSRSYYELRRFVRTQTKEGAMQVPLPREYHADTTRLVQLLKNGHYDVRLDEEAWDRIVTWIDLNAPFHGNWHDILMEDKPGMVRHQFARRHDLRRRYAGVDSLLDDDPDVEYPVAVLAKSVEPGPIEPGLSGPGIATPEKRITSNVSPSGADAPASLLTLALADDVDIELVHVPGQNFFMSTTEITNRQFSVFDPKHDSRIEYGDFMHFSPGEQGWSVSHPSQPVVRVSWNRAVEFCRRLSKKTGKNVALPTEEQWEYACRAGTTTPFWYGTVDTDFSPFANLSDVNNQRIDPFSWAGRVETLPPWRPADARFDDGSRVAAPVGSYRPNPWGLFDMHGNVAEWTASSVSDEKPSRKIVKGGSWYDTPKRAQVAFRQDYLAEQPVYDVGFRIVVLPE